MSYSYYSYWSNIISKMPCGRTYSVPFYGTVSAQKSSKSNKRQLFVFHRKSNLDEIRSDLLQISSKF